MEEVLEEVQLSKRERKELKKEEKIKTKRREEINKALKKLLTGIIVLGIVGIGAYKIWRWFTSPEPEVVGINQEVSQDDWIKGNKDARVSLIEYGDYQCPACAAYLPLIEKLLQDFPNDIKFVYRHFPLVSIHRNATSSAKAAEAAGIQGKFWEMHKLLYEKQDEWENERNEEDIFLQYAKDIGLNLERFKEDFESKTVEDAVNKDLTLSQTLGLNSTPTFFLNGRKINIRNYEDLKAQIEKELGR